jgi:hypothetical protein
MVAVAFDTLKFAQTLRDKAKLTPEQAEGISQAFADATGEQLATKADLSSLATKADIAEVKADLMKWMFGAIGFQTLIILGAVLALVKFSQ